MHGLIVLGMKALKMVGFEEAHQTCPANNVFISICNHKAEPFVLQNCQARISLLKNTSVVYAIRSCLRIIICVKSISPESFQKNYGHTYG
jgi:hypothetical protein